MGIHTDAFMIVGLPIRDFTREEIEEIREAIETEDTGMMIISRYYDHETDIGVCVQVVDNTTELMHNINTAKATFQFITGKIGKVQVLPNVT